MPQTYEQDEFRTRWPRLYYRWSGNGSRWYNVENKISRTVSVLNSPFSPEALAGFVSLAKGVKESGRETVVTTTYGGIDVSLVLTADRLDQLEAMEPQLEVVD